MAQPANPAYPANSTQAASDVEVLVVDDQMPFRLASSAVVDATDGFHLWGTAADAAEAVEIVLGSPVAPGLILMDVNLGEVSGIDATRQILAERPEVSIVLVSTIAEPDLPVDASTCGAAGYLPKSRLSPRSLTELAAAAGRSTAADPAEHNEATPEPDGDVTAAAGGDGSTFAPMATAREHGDDEPTRRRVVLADDNLLIREGVAAVLRSIEGVELVAECGDVDSLLSAVAESNPDVVITDIRMPPTHTDEGIAAALQIRADNPDLGVIVLSQFSDPAFVLALFENGSDGLGYLLKERVNPDDLARAITAVVAGESMVDAKIVEVLVQARSQRSSAIDRLTPREREVLGLIAEGLNNAAVAEALVLSDKAVAKHINNIFSKLDLGGEPDAHRRVKAVLLWLSH